MAERISNQAQLGTKGNLVHLLGLEGLSKDSIIYLIEYASSFLDSGRLQYVDTLSNVCVANLFFEPSTRTRNTFELAAKRCGAMVINIDLENSALKKNESLDDTIKTLEAMQIDMFVVRHKLNGLPHKIARSSNSIIINAGDGINAHPTQGLLDMFTIYQHHKDLSKLAIAIIGDIKHSRVAHSDIAALLTLGVKDIRLVSPPALGYSKFRQAGVTHTHNIDSAIVGADVVIMLRLQKERMLASDIPNENEYFKSFGLNEKRLTLAKPDVLLMHPGPINREVEIASEVADGKHSVILPQVTNGIAIRMAVMSLLAK